MMRTQLRIMGCWILAAAVFAVSGFGQMTSKTVDGVLVVKNGKNPVPPSGAAAKLVLEPIYTIGGGATPEQDFSSITGITVQNDGSVFVLDTKECLIRAFDAKGRFLFSFGKKGQGPGELNTPIGVMITPSKEILVEDALNRRLSFFSLDGKFLRHQSAAQGMGITGILMDDRGRIVARAMSFTDGKIAFEIKTYDKDLNALKSLARVDLANLGQLKVDPLSSAPGLVFAPDGRGNLFLGSPKGYLIRVFDFDGRLLRTIERDYDPTPVKKEDQAEIFKLLGGIQATGGFNVKEMVVFPDYFPPYVNFVANPDGRLLVRTYEKGKALKEYFYDVFDADGRYTLRFPSALEIQVWRDEKLYGLEENEDGFKILKCFQTRWEK
jgi:hypothetical protein